MQFDNGGQRRDFHDALLSAFPRRINLEEMLSFEFNIVLNRIATGDSYSEVVFRLIQWAESQGKLQKLIDAAYKYNPGNPKLKAFCEQFQKSQSVGEKFYNLINPCNFDLSSLIEKCLSQVYEKSGLVGLVLPCDEDAFQKHFNQRLKQELGKSNMQIKTPLTLSPQITSIDTVINTIKKYKKSLTKTDILCPVRVQNYPNDSAITDELWQKISIEFEEEFNHSLIVILLGNEDRIFPKCLMRLEPPQFEQFHVHQWVVRLTKNLEWEVHIREEWKQKMIAECCVDSLENNSLNIRYVYDHLEKTWELFQDMQNNLSPEAFLAQLEQRI